MGSLYASEEYGCSALGKYFMIGRALEWKLQMQGQDFSSWTVFPQQITSKRWMLTCLQHQFRNGLEEFGKGISHSRFLARTFHTWGQVRQTALAGALWGIQDPLGQVCKNMTLLYSSTWSCRMGKQNSSLYFRCDLTIKREHISLKFDWLWSFDP